MSASDIVLTEPGLSVIISDVLRSHALFFPKLKLNMDAQQEWVGPPHAGRTVFFRLWFRIEVWALLDEDIPNPLSSTPIDDVAAPDKPNEVRLGPITRARAKLLEQQI
ncbi:uncharacterized protein LOC104583772 [Brachypodium distachyon]|uniref:uncharacterized protein LOC104583772 n=1 Tax=Brachypodium distachyon TaxID=15368 RepID=UPI000D0D1A93|nr:uncharacterized protein LOC104583772 [Brachypodium distachyon]|eukprot:XP_024317850.1 uncharacterized protein LOC104583772 [Brachypodium distachyon]